MTTKQRYTAVLNEFEKLMPNATTELVYNSPYQLLVAVILSAQCTDKRVNEVTPALFKAYPTVQDMSKASHQEILQYIASISYPNSKAKHLAAMARMVTHTYGGEIPNNREQLVTLPGVGRKTANVMLIVCFNKPAMPVDTHVFRVSKRIGLVKKSTNTPEQCEQQLIQHIPTHLMNKAHHWLILHGRYTCKARKPLCEQCPIAKFCVSAPKTATHA